MSTLGVTAPAPDGLAAIAVGFEIAGVGGTGDEAKEFDRATAFDVKILNLLGGKGVRAFATGGRGDCIGLGSDGDGLRVGGHRHLDAGNGNVVADTENDVLTDEGPEPCKSEACGIGGGWQVGEGEETTGVALNGATALVRRLCERDRGAWDGGSGGVLDSAGDGGGADLCVDGGRAECE